MTFETINIDVDDRGIATVTLNLPDTRNALSGKMIEELTRAAAQLGNDRSVRAVVLRGAGKVFCAGGDLTWMKAQIEADRAARMTEARKLATMLGALNAVPKPLICRVHGGAYGGGVGLACICDTAVASDKTRFALTETRLGLIPATIGPYVIARIGEGMARRVFMSARIFDAQEAERLGIVARVVADEDLDDAIAAEVEPYLHVSGEAVARAKALARYLGPAIDAEVVDETIQRLADAWETDDAKAGIASFLNKTAPPWA